MGVTETLNAYPTYIIAYLSLIYCLSPVNVISPGPTDTELFTVGKTAEQIQRFTQMTALGRLGKVEDIADVTAFLCSEQARWITGQNIRVNGGIA